MLDRWTDAATFDIAEEMTHLTLDIIARTLFGVDLGDSGSRTGRTRCARFSESFVRERGQSDPLSRLGAHAGQSPQAVGHQDARRIDSRRHSAAARQRQGPRRPAVDAAAGRRRAGGRTRHDRRAGPRRSRDAVQCRARLDRRARWPGSGISWPGTRPSKTGWSRRSTRRWRVARQHTPICRDCPMPRWSSRNRCGCIRPRGRCCRAKWSARSNWAVTRIAPRKLGLHVALGHASRSALVPGAREVRSRAICPRPRRADSAICLLSLWRRSAGVHRQHVCHDGDDPDHWPA